MSKWILLITLAASPCFAVEYREFHYTPKTFETWYVSQNAYNSASGHVWPKHQSYNGQRNANLRGDWVRPAGTRGMRSIAVRRTLKLPIGGPKIKVRGRQWTFPDGAIIEEKLYEKGSKLFAERAREKIDGQWEMLHDDVHYEPVGYQQVTRDCKSCHDLAGRQVPESSQYRESLRGSDGVFSFSPIDRFGRIRPGLKAFVQVVR